MTTENTQASVPALRTGGAIQPIVPQNIEEIWRVAGILYKSGMAPKALASQEQTMAVLMQGQEVGLPAMAALQSIAMINGRPTIWGDGALGLVQGSGKMEWIKEWSEGEPGTDAYTAFCSVKRRNDPEVKTNSFSIAQAKKAKLWNKQGPWTDYPMRQIKMRPRSWSLRDGFSDVLKGIGITEEVMDIPPDQVEHTVVSSGPLAGTGAPVADLKMPTVKPADEQPQAADTAVDPGPSVVFTDWVINVHSAPDPSKGGQMKYAVQTKTLGAKKLLGTYDEDMVAVALQAKESGAAVEVEYSLGDDLKAKPVLVSISTEAHVE